MPRLLAIFGLVLAVLTGFVLGQLHQFTVEQPLTAPVSPDASRETVQAFYDGINHFLATDDDAVSGLLAPDFVDHRSNSDVTRSAGEMLDNFAAVRTRSPALQMRVVDVRSDGHIMTVELAIDGIGTDGVSSLAPLNSGSATTLEILRLERGTISERWSQDDDLISTSLVTHFNVSSPGSKSIEPRIERWTLDPQVAIDLKGELMVQIVVEAGGLGIDLDGVDAFGQPMSTNAPIQPGEARIVNAEGHLRLRNASEGAAESVEFYLVTLRSLSTPKDSAGSFTYSSPLGVHREVLSMAAFTLPARTAGPYLISVERSTFPVGTTFPAHTPDVLEIVAVLDGSLEAKVLNGTAIHSFPINLTHGFNTSIVARGGEGFAAVDNAQIEYRVEGSAPATLLIMTIEPARNSSDGPGNASGSIEM